MIDRDLETPAPCGLSALYKRPDLPAYYLHNTYLLITQVDAEYCLIDTLQNFATIGRNFVAICRLMMRSTECVYSMNLPATAMSKVGGQFVDNRWQIKVLSTPTCMRIVKRQKVKFFHSLMRP